jgi:histidinol-phosphate aminotransferase
VQPLHGRVNVARAPEPVAAVAGVDRWPDPGPERDGLVGLDRNERLAPLPDWFLAELSDSLRSATLSTYPTPTLLRDELAVALGVPREAVLVTPGTDPALRSVHLAFVRPGDRVVRLDPTYAMVPVYGRMFGAEDVPVGFDDDLGFDADRLLASVEPGVRLVVLANPNQPTGTVLDEEILRTLADRCGEVGALLVLDEAYYGFSPVTGLGLVDGSENVLVLRTFSKAAGLAGLRVGFAVGSSGVIRALGNVRAAGEVNALGIAAARLVVRHPEVVDDYVRLVAEGKAVLESHARELGLEPLPTHANFQLLRLPAGVDPAVVSERLRSSGFLVRGPFADRCLARCIRPTLGPPELMTRFAGELAAALETQQ